MARQYEHHRRSIRMQGYDYSQPGAYFVTICTQGKQSFFGDIVHGTMQLNDAGNMVIRWYGKIEEKFQNIYCDECVCMPNHVHFIVVNNKTKYTLNQIVQWFKTMTTNDYIRGVKQLGWPQFSGKLWQRNYWERAIRNAEELKGIREYIINNPLNWCNDDNNPQMNDASLF